MTELNSRYDIDGFPIAFQSNLAATETTALQHHLRTTEYATELGRKFFKSIASDNLD